MNLGYHCWKSSQNSFFPTGVIPERKRIGLYVSSMSSWKLWGTSLTVTFYTFHPNHLTRGWKNYHHFREKNWGEVRNADLVYNSLGWQTGICLHCMLQASAKWMRVFSVHVPCWKRSACMSMSGQHQAQPSRESLSPWLCSLRHDPASANMATWP